MADQEQGVDQALRKAGDGTITPESYKKIAELLGVKLQFIYTCRRKGFFPPERARVVSDAYGIPLSELVSAPVRALLNATSN